MQQTEHERASLVGYHATDHLYDKPNYERLLSNITNHDNGALGLWCSFETRWIKGSFGKHIYRVEIEGSSYNMPIDELAGMCQTCRSQEDYTHRRNELLQQGYDIIRIVEMDGSCDMFVVMNFDTVKMSLVE